MTYFTRKRAQKRADYLNAGREDGPWEVEYDASLSFWQRRYEVVFHRPDNY